MDSNEIVRRNIVEFRRLAGGSQAWVAHALSIDQSQYSRLETGDTKISLEHIKQLSLLYDRPIDDFFKEDW